MTVKILIINLKLIGDLIVSTAAIRSIKAAFPESKIDVIIRKGFEQILEGNPDINFLVPFDKSSKDMGFVGRLLYEIQFIKKLRSNKYDLVVALQPGDRYAIWSFLSGAARRVGVKKQNFSLLFNNLSLVEEDTISYLDYYLKITADAGGKEVLKQTTFFINDSDFRTSQKILADSNFSLSDKIIVIHPGASDRSRCWSVGNFINLIHEIQKLSGIQVVLSFGPSERDIISEFDSNLRDVIICDHTLGIKVIGAFIKKSALCISNDTSVRHISVALGTPVITLMPDDIADYWNFYNDPVKEFVILGKRGNPNSPDINQRSLHGMAVLEVLAKVREYLKI
ncbi:MAG: glycosyltransferase family 9 protein [Ignavibacteriaceae bacterium]